MSSMIWWEPVHILSLLQGEKNSELAHSGKIVVAAEFVPGERKNKILNGVVQGPKENLDVCRRGERRGWGRDRRGAAKKTPQPPPNNPPVSLGSLVNVSWKCFGWPWKREDQEDAKTLAGRKKT